MRDRVPRVTMLSPLVRTLDTSIAAPPAKVGDPFYASPEWRALVDQVISLRGRICQDPHCRKPNGPWRRIEADHIIELRDGGAPLDPDNVLLRCSSCHVRKTIRERARRQAASHQGRQGKP